MHFQLLSSDCDLFVQKRVLFQTAYNNESLI